MMLNSTMKKTFRAALAIVCAGTLMAGTAACGSTSSSGGDKVALLVSTLNNPFFVDLRDGAQAAAKDLGVDLMVSDAQNDSSTQQNQAQNAQSQGAKAVIINPVDSDAASPAVAPLLSSSLPVISVDRSVTGEDVTSHIASDNVAGGAQAADELAKAVGEKARSSFSRALRVPPPLAIVATASKRRSRSTPVLKSWPNRPRTSIVPRRWM